MEKTFQDKTKGNYKFKRVEPYYEIEYSDNMSDSTGLLCFVSPQILVF